jgi:branched-chain amino acid transport system substrate-binding protein
MLPAACERADDRSVIIGLAWPEDPPYAPLVAQALIDSTTSPGEPLILVRPVGAGEASDSGSLETDVSQAMQLAAGSNVIAVVGHPSSTGALLAAPIYTEAGIPILVPTATTRRLASAGQLVFPLVPNDSIEGAFIAHFAVERLAANTVLLFHVVDDYGVGLASGVEDALDGLGATVLDRVPVRLDQPCPPFSDINHYQVQVDASLLKGEPDVVVVAGRRWELGCIAQALHERVEGTPVIAGDGVAPLDSVVTDTAGPALDFVYLVTFWDPEAATPQATAFRERFRRTAGRAPRADEALVHDAIMLVATAVREVGADREAVGEYLRSLGRNRPPYTGVVGEIDFETGRQRPLLMMRFMDGQPRRVELP